MANTIEAVLKSATRAAGGRLVKRVRGQFASSTDPYGRGWAPLRASTLRRKSGRSGGILVRTGAMRNSTRWEPSGLSGRLLIDGPARYHQDGTRYMSARKLLPDNGMPATWEADIRSSLTDRASNLVAAVATAVRAAIGAAARVTVR